MYRYLPLLAFLFFSCLSAKEAIPYYGEADVHRQAIIRHQAEMNEWFADPERSPLTAEDRTKFESLDFFPIAYKYQVKARFVATPDAQPFEMPTTTDRLPEYKQYGELHFELDGTSLKLNVYKNLELTDRKYRDYLFIPFRDQTSGVESYGGGRYLDLEIPKDDNWVIDFNRSYNPYCAYNDRYSCPIPPAENTLEVSIFAGVKAYDKH
ncbi:MAG: DUF1684 domain-containing protein [Bacteroidetes bacterium]|nr:DUF1684 domain-containing protein [Bacteroidota bacterium]